MQYLERLAPLGLYDPLLIGGGGGGGGSAASAPASPALPERASALRAWEEAWSSLADGGVGDHDNDSDVPPGVFWQHRKPDLRIVHPPPPPRWPSSSLSRATSAFTVTGAACQIYPS